jgi:tetratricopeptide (TPR) repeat protein
MALDNALINDSTNIILLLMRGMAAEGYATGIGQRGREDSIRYYTKVLDLDPSNMAAHHFLVHSYEMTSQVDKAIEQAAIYQKLAPAVAHAHHMYGHDLRRTEGLQQAIAQFEKADQITEDFYRSEPETLLYDWNYRHNLSLLGAAYAQAGLLPDAARTLKKLAALPSMTPADDLYRANLMAFLLHEGNEDGAITAAAPLISSQFALGRLLGHVLSGSAAARLQDAKRASKELALAEKEATNLEPAWYGLVVTQMEILRAQVELLQGEREHPVSRLRTLVVRMCSMPGSDVWSDSVFHLRFIAEVAMKSGEWDLARFVAHQLETHAPYYAGTHSILALVAQHDGDNAGASRESNLARRLRQP